MALVTLPPQKFAGSHCWRYEPKISMEWCSCSV